MLLTEHSFKNRVPYKLLRNSDDLSCEWLYLGEGPFVESSFDQTINRCKQLPENRDGEKHISPVSALFEWAEKIDAAEVAGFIFHISRCGSTMVSQLLSLRREHIVLPEVPFFDDILRMPQTQGLENASLFKAALKFYSQKRTGFERKVFIKTDSWHILFHKEIRKQFPAVPFFLLYRTPGEVVRSLNKAAGMHCVPQIIDPQFFGIESKVATIQDFYDYPIRVIEKYLETYINVLETDPRFFLLNYSEGMLPIIEKIGNAAGIKFTESELAAMQKRLLFHSKHPQIFFLQEPASRKIDEKFSRVIELYNRVEAARINQARNCL
jgi:hypothetical protein